MVHEWSIVGRKNKRKRERGRERGRKEGRKEGRLGKLQDATA